MIDERARDVTTDLVVVGGGGAGLAAAAEGAARGLKVLLIEKAEKLGGTTALSVGTIMAAGTAQQKAAGIADSPAQHAKDLDDIRRAMGIDDDATLRQMLTENVAETVETLRGVGINFLGPLPQPPHSVARMHQVMPTSRSYIFNLSRHCKRAGVDIRLNTRLVALQRENGRVVGIEAETPDGRLRARARAGVVLACGDIGGDTALMHKYMKNWVDGIEVYNPQNTGEGHLAAQAVGAKIQPRKDLGAEAAAHIRFVPPKRIFLQRIPPYPVITRAMIAALKVLPPALIRPFMMKFLTTTLGPDRGVYEHGAILVNKLGERFGEELGGAGLAIPRQPEGKAYIVFDQRFATKFNAWPHFISTAPGVAFAFVDDYRRARPELFFRGATVAELAAAAGFSPQRLQATLDAVNAGRAEDRKLATPSFYALGPVKLYVMVAPVGLAVNTKLEVLDDNGQPIPGLYAAGNAGQGGFSVTGHGHGLGWAFTTGRLAARNAAAQASGVRQAPVA